MIVSQLLARFRALVADTSAVAYVEFALTLPVFMTMALSGAEIAHYVTTKMRMSQLALHIADHSARIGSGSALAARQISETQINDALTGAAVQAGNLGLFTNGRVIISSLEPVSNPNSTPPKYKIGWQRCRGVKNRVSSYGLAGATNLDGMGPVGPPNRQITAPEGGATMFVELYYEYQPLISSRLAPSTAMVEIGAMPVRDRRDLSQIYNPENLTAAQKATCDRFTAT